MKIINRVNEYGEDQGYLGLIFKNSNFSKNTSINSC